MMCSPLGMAAPLAQPHLHFPSSSSSSSCRSSSASASRCIVSAHSPVSWESFHLSKSPSRRSFSLAFVLLHSFSSKPQHAYASSIFDKYMKRKKLDPLEAYVPAVVLTQFQFKDIAKTLENDQPQYADCRSLLRSGPAASLRINIRAVAQYASDDGKGKVAFDAVDRCIGALEDLDSLLLQASRNNPAATVESMKAKISTALGALDSLLQTVPPTLLERGKAVADAYRKPSDPEESNPEELDTEMRQLTEIL